MTSNETYMTTMFEQMLEHFKIMSEGFAQMHAQMKTLATKEELREVANDVKAIKAALTETNVDLRDLDRRFREHTHPL